ncbi:GDSL-type esterase/lipase family protein [Amycolatopsis rhabdoformis]|uniref:GDSL-type esterase/lipase family protein n=1 Tax=Amycolatopsis rhabdoformis TaxID=1448059 RepID=A0ABZ1IGJ4_9PSEU|nr:GDSL-type esterase/lipase family protein [Amycolatopsis rhabdoformis]WSE33238.1 GDSL-type esterase/lipase family protein [Amycolatopsis rhabdoformis]
MPDLELSVIGDSFAEGRGGLVRPDGSFAGFTTHLAQCLGVSGEVLNLGSYGATTQDVVDHQLATALARPAALTGVIVGGNDLVTDYDRARFRRNLTYIFSSLARPGRLVFTTNWPRIPDRLPGLPDAVRSTLRERFAEANEFLDGLVLDLGLVCLDLANAPVTADPVMWCPDGMHPSAAGHQVIGTALADLVDEARSALI